MQMYRKFTGDVRLKLDQLFLISLNLFIVPSMPKSDDVELRNLTLVEAGGGKFIFLNSDIPRLTKNSFTHVYFNCGITHVYLINSKNIQKVSTYHNILLRLN
jgi:hypothetical protein